MIVRGDAKFLPLADNSVDCIISSPPYDQKIVYPHYDDNLGAAKYERLASRSAREMFRVMKPNTRLWLNVAPTLPDDTADNGTRAALGVFWHNILYTVGFEYRDTVIWVQDSYDGGCAWGSWRSPSAPNLRGSYESILLFFKGDWKRPNTTSYADDFPSQTLWQDLCRNVWKIQPSRNRDYPATFPDELVARAIRLSTYPGDVVLDPFSGSHTTARVAEKMGRRGIGVDLYAGV